MIKTAKWVQAGLGFLLISPLDELLHVAPTGGATLPIAGAQLPVTALLGALLIADAFGVKLPKF